ncbi:hypothetical protein B7R54_15985 [Subtercola boreus]|uniref:Bulb-type lectin domain-containing protein n=1 Tax=Subtercola boreus TaxID=120213 RepID=A0A3E0VM45_9MICO|nr:hypothetical protein [Subtercola boreus]RFA10538.1 hypothetical protein B7R54_15985 [Subtercola boreus]TQL55923.1 D-mannose binding lectin [Subtercola boreus]
MNKYQKLAALFLVTASIVGGGLLPQAANAEASDVLVGWGNGDYVEYLPGYERVGSNGAKFAFQTDGNVVLYSSAGRPVWQSRTYGRGASKLSLQLDGNIVVYRADNTPLWSAGVSKHFSGYWSLRLSGTGASPRMTETNESSGSTTHWRIP